MADDYIRREDAVDALAKTMPTPATPDGVGDFDHEIHIADEAFADAIRIIESIEPADVAPVKYGEWISTPEMWGAFDIRYYCSECGKDAIINNGERYVLSDYCPHCGAIMGNKRGNENG